MSDRVAPRLVPRLQRGLLVALGAAVLSACGSPAALVAPASGVASSSVRRAPVRAASALELGPERLLPPPMPTRPPQPEPQAELRPVPTPPPAPPAAPTPAATPAPASAALDPVPWLQASFEGAQTSYYDVWGSSAAEIIASMNRQGPAAINYAVPAGIAFTWFEVLGYPDWTYAQSADGCVVLDHGLQYSLTVYLPRWRQDAASPALIAWWRAAFEQIRRHEAEHVRLWNANLPGLDAYTRGTPCVQLGDAVISWAQMVKAQQAAWERADLPLIFPPGP